MLYMCIRDDTSIFYISGSQTVVLPREEQAFIGEGARQILESERSEECNGLFILCITLSYIYF
jgi:hypothetical protein